MLLDFQAAEVADRIERFLESLKSPSPWSAA
jgi:hypothetical protein